MFPSPTSPPVPRFLSVLGATLALLFCALVPTAHAAVVVVLPTATTDGSLQFTQDLTFTITKAGGLRGIALDEWVTSDGQRNFGSLRQNVRISVNGGAETTFSPPLLADNTAIDLGNLSPNDGYVAGSNAVAVIVGDTVTFKSGTYQIAATGDALNPQCAQTFTGNVFLFDSSGLRLSPNVPAGPVPPTVGSPTHADETTSTATLGATVSSDNGAAITERGILYSTTNNPQLNGANVSKVAATGTTGAFTVFVNSLAAGTSYFYRAYATSSDGTGYSIVDTFRTSAEPVGQPPAYDDFRTPTTSGSGFSDLWSNALSRKTNLTYSGLNSGGSAAGVPATGIQSFRMLTNAQTTGIVYFAALFKGVVGNYANVTFYQDTTEKLGFGVVDSRGPVRAYGTHDSQNGERYVSSGVSVDGDTHLLILKVDLDANTSALYVDPDLAQPLGAPNSTTTAAAGQTYDFNRLRLEISGSGVIDELRVVTVDPELIETQLTSPADSDPTVTSVTTTGATLGGNVTADGGSPIIKRGIVFAKTSENADPAIGGSMVTQVVVAGTTGVFTTDVTGLTASTGYSFKAYASNAQGVTYTDVSSFTTANEYKGVDDAILTTSGTTRIYPLANDVSPSGQPLRLVSVSDPAIRIEGRTLLIPAGYTGTFTYRFTDGTTTGVASVVVGAGTPVANAYTYTGLLFDRTGAIAGSADTLVSPSGSASLLLKSGKSVVRTRIKVGPAGMPGTVTTTAGTITLARNNDGTLDITLTKNNVPVAGSLVARRVNAPRATYRIALASTDPAIPGGGFATATVSTLGRASVMGVLPDGRPFSGATTVRDNGIIGFYTVASATTKTPAIVAGELVVADLAQTDVTGELAWMKPAQPAGTAGLQPGAVDTILTARGSVSGNPTALAGLGTLRLSGGDFADPETTPITVTSGKPAVPNGSLKGWTVSTIGTFTAKIAVPGTTAPVSGKGIYLLKSREAFGFFPGKTVGGRIELTVDPSR